MPSSCRSASQGTNVRLQPYLRMIDLLPLVFLIQLLLIIALLLSEVLFMSPDMSLLAIPYRFVLRKLLPDVYGDGRDATLTIHPFLASGMLFVSVTTLVLFFASGMYAEKIAYANKCVFASLPRDQAADPSPDTSRTQTALSVPSTYS